MATANRVIAFMGPGKVEVKSIGYPKLQNPKGKKIEHGFGVIPRRAGAMHDLVVEIDEENRLVVILQLFADEQSVVL